jgi:hypothetical protein
MLVPLVFKLAATAMATLVPYYGRLRLAVPRSPLEPTTLR